MNDRLPADHLTLQAVRQCRHMASHNELGEKGEELAVSHLVQKGYDILDRNWRFGREEIDIVARIGQELIIAEVKTRQSDFFGQPEASVSRSKQAHLVKAAHAYVERNDLDLEVRFDVIGIVLNAREQRVVHIEGAFQPRW